MAADYCAYFEPGGLLKSASGGKIALRPGVVTTDLCILVHQSHDWLLIGRLDRQVGSLQSAIQFDLLYVDFRQLRAALKFGEEIGELYTVNGLPMFKSCLTGYRMSGVGERNVGLLRGQESGGVEGQLSFLR